MAKILIVEDEKPLSAAICRMLEQEHYSVDAAYTGPDGLDSALSGIYDAIILDVMLPGMDGFTLLRELRGGGSSLPVLMLTARSELSDRVRGLDYGVIRWSSAGSHDVRHAVLRDVRAFLG